MTKPVKLLRWAFSLVRLLFASALITVFLTPSWAFAQSTDDTWSQPLNLSHSGIAKNPSMVSDADGVVHVVWQDDASNYIYTQFDGNQWSAPETTNLNLMFELPADRAYPGQSVAAIYTGTNPMFITAPGSHIYAFWISSQGKLLTSKVKSQDFEHIAAWDARNFIAPEAASFAVAIDESGELHVVYIRTVGDSLSPPGVYYTRSKNGGLIWSVPVLLYESSYLRRLAPGEANLSIAITGTGDTQHLYIAWDNRPRRQVFLAQSADGGASWEQPKLVAAPTPDSGLAGAFNIQVGVTQNSVVLTWQSGRETNGLLPACSQIYQSSNDAGVTWSDPQPMIENLLGCAQSNKFVTGSSHSNDSSLYFLIESTNQVFLTVWNGRRWSQPQEQPILSGFEEPEIHTDVLYSCHQASLAGDQLYIVGCDKGEGGDVWATSRNLGSVGSWFKAPVWSQLSPVSTNDYKVEAVKLVSTDDGLIHAFFSQHEDRAIYYTYWNGQYWSRISPVLELPEGEYASPAVAAGPGNELLLIAHSNAGTLYYSRAISGNASTESHWSTAAQLKTRYDGEIGSMDVAWDPAGTVYVVYSVPVNEKRGIYMVQSKDQGTSWSEPIQVFNGAKAGFDVVGAPSILASANGELQIIWKEQSIQGDGEPHPRSLFYTRSEDSGQTFSNADMVVEEPVAWQEILTDAKGNLHLLWQPQDTLTTVWDQISLDGGKTWQYPKGLPDEGKLATALTDPAGGLHLMGFGLGNLNHWLWDGSEWQSETPLHSNQSSQQENPVELLSAVVNKQGKMMVVLAEPTATGDQTSKTLLFSIRALELSSNHTSVQEISTKTPLPLTLTPVPSTPVQLVTPTSVAVPTDITDTNDQSSPFTTAIVPVALLLLAVLGIVMWQATQAKDR